MPDSSRHPRLLVIKVNQLGDNIIFLPALQEFQRHFPNWHISVLTTSIGGQIFSRYLPGCEIYEIDAARFLSAWRQPRRLAPILQWVRCRQPDAVLLGVEPSHTAHLLSLLSGSPHRVGVQPPRRTFPFSLTEKVTWTAEEPIAEVNWKAARLLGKILGVTDWPEHAAPPDLSNTPKFSSHQKRIVIHSGASRPYQQWPVDRYAALAARLSSDYEVVCLGTKRDLSAFPSGPYRKEILSNVPDLVSWIESAALFIGNNSGPMHIASALGKSSLILSGPSSPVWDPYWYPDRVRVLRATGVDCLPCDRWNKPAGLCQNQAQPLACLHAWPVEVVEKTAREILSRLILVSG